MINHVLGKKTYEDQEVAKLEEETKF